MQTYNTIESFRQARQSLIGTLGIVPTMGYLHAGHLKLMETAQSQNDHCAVSIFVNPTQFNNPADLATYPTDLERDLKLLAAQGVALVFMPTPQVMYPKGYQTYINVEKVSQGLEGEHRPGHFRGVATVVCKFFNIMQPTRAYFGQKDAQQVRVIQQMAHDLNFPLEIVVCPTLRETDGLAMSSRNVKLSATERAAAPIIYRALLAAQERYQQGERHPQQLKTAMLEVLALEPIAHLEYLSIADHDSLQELDQPTTGPLLISLAALFGSTRLIDNIVLQM
jgi:pantoate--beta-alanine ligase